MNWYLSVLKNYAGFSGRARRQEYWMFALVNVVVTIVLSALARISGSSVLYVVYCLYLLAVLIPSLAVFVRRMHDTGKSGAWFFIGFIPIVGFIWLIVLAATEGQSGANQYGPDPKAPAYV
jgi:uncharacterized membrane protein YhaH (DUF805 family)